MKQAVIVFQKALVLGEVKTRIATTLGEEKALQIYQYLVTHTHNELNSLKNTEVFLFQNKFLEDQEKNFPLNFRFHLQKGNDLGEKMQQAFEEIFELGFEKVLIIGTDCLDLRVDILEKAFQSLNDYPCVIGPAEDGGYYLLGLQKMIPQLFDGIPWSTPVVFEETCKHLHRANIKFGCLEYLKDIDTEQDWIASMANHQNKNL